MLNYHQSSLFIAGSRGDWVISEWSSLEPNGHLVIICPPFAEELNRSRQPLSQLAQQLAVEGFQVVLPDLFGTGDAQGDFSEVDFEAWVNDLTDWIYQQKQLHVHFLAVRFGVQLLSQLLSQPAIKQRTRSVLLWQPQLDVPRFWHQFWRLALASNMVRQQRFKPDQQLADYGFVDIQGYVISQKFYQQTLTLPAVLPSLVSLPLLWLEVTDQQTLSPLLQKQFSDITSNNPSTVAIETIQSHPFWLSQELGDVKSLISRSLKFYQDMLHG